jgi:two-component system, OmpR family, response regulator
MAQARPKAAVLVVDADLRTVEQLSVGLRLRGFAVHTAADGPTALRCARRVRPDAVILEVALPGMDGFELLGRLRAHGVHAPGLFLSIRASLQDRLTGLAVGGDDYITKPFNVEEVLARLCAVLRRSCHGAEARGSDPILSYSDLELYEDSHEAWRSGRPVTLTPDQFKLLRYLMLNADIVLSKSTIFDHVWPNDARDATAIVQSRIHTLRRKIDTGGKPLIHTVRQLGYVLHEPR